MARNYGTTSNGYRFPDQLKLAVWDKSAISTSNNPSEYRLDFCGALIKWDHYGVTTEYGAGWEIDHIFPVSRGGTDSLNNLQALQWQHNRIKGDSIDVDYCHLTERK